MERIILEVVHRRRKDNLIVSDLLGILMAARNRDTGRPMSDRHLVNEIKTLIVAAHETTASTLNWVWYLLSQHGEVERRLAMELDSLESASVGLDELSKYTYTRQVIEEALRLYLAGWLLTRRALKDDRLGDCFVPAGTEIYIPIYYVQRHPDLWEEPDRFDPDRFAPNRVEARHRLAMLPFSAGPRNCVGEVFARVEMQIHLITIAKRLTLGKRPEFRYWRELA